MNDYEKTGSICYKIMTFSKWCYRQFHKQTRFFLLGIFPERPSLVQYYDIFQMKLNLVMTLAKTNCVSLPTYINRLYLSLNPRMTSSESLSRQSDRQTKLCAGTKMSPKIVKIQKLFVYEELWHFPLLHQFLGSSGESLKNLNHIG